MMRPAHFLLYYGLVAMLTWLIWLVWRRPGAARALVIGCLGLYVGLVAAGTHFPMPVHADVIADFRFRSDWRTHNFVPLGTITSVLRDQPWSVARRQLLGNVIMLAPLGVLLPLMSRRMRPAMAVGLAAMIVSLVIESSQYLISKAFGFVYSTADVDDLLLNTAGGLLGWALYRTAMGVPPLVPLLAPFHLDPGDGEDPPAPSPVDSGPPPPGQASPLE
jgi:glycopeptide antibiotics resistance protein